MAAHSSASLDRRTLLKTVAALSGGLLLELSLAPRATAAEAGHGPALNAWVRVGTDDRVTLIVSQCEIGQGITTTLPAILADELGADWSRVRTENAPVAEPYRNPNAQWMYTGNSESIMVFSAVMRRAGAAAREMLTEAAARRWNVEPASCRAENGAVLHPPSGRRLSFGAVAEDAARLPVPSAPKLRSEAELKLVGRAVPRRDVPGKCDGSAVFGLDFRVPGMLYAVPRQAPVFGGAVQSFDAASVANRPGVIAVVPIPNGVAVVAERFWQAKTAADALLVTFTEPPDAFALKATPGGAPVASGAAAYGSRRSDEAAGRPVEPAAAPGLLTSDSLERQYREALEKGPWFTPEEKGDAAAAVERAGSAAVAREYWSPFQAHATMEPMNATAQVHADGSCDVWVPTQGPDMTLAVASATLQIPKEKVRVHWTLSGGGFGRRLVADFVAQAVLAAKAVGRPVKVVWTREEDFAHDLYRPATLTRITAALDAEGRPAAIRSRLVSPSQLQFVYPQGLQDNFDARSAEGLEVTRYRVPSFRLDFHLLKVGVPTSVLRTTGYGPNVFALESFVDELAHAAGEDPYRYRRALLFHDARALAVLDLAAEKAGWGSPLAAGRGRGIAFADAFGTLLAQVVELSVDPADKTVRVHRVVSAVDPGRVFDPGIGASNIEGGVAWGLTTCLKGEVTFERGRAYPKNFNTYDLLHLWEMPRAVETHFIEGDRGAEKPGGLGEVGPIPTVPAFANALFAATGERVRRLPVTHAGYSAAV